MEGEDLRRGGDGKFLKYIRKRGGETPLGTERRMFDNIIKTDLKATRCEEVYVYQTHRSQDNDQWRVPLNMATPPRGLSHINYF